MKTQAILFFIVFSFTATLSAQTLSGVWEGSFFLHGKKKHKMSVRMELMETDGDYTGVVYTRGFDRNTSFGCDYIVGGRVYKGKICLDLKYVKHAVAMSETECAYFQGLCLTVPQNNSVKTITGNWCWTNEECDVFTASKTDTVMSALAQDEIDGYEQELYERFEKNNILVSPGNRIYQKLGELEIDSTDILLDFSSIDSSIHASIRVLLNGEEIANSTTLAKRPLRIRLKKLDPGVHDVIVISQSVVQSKLNIRLQVNQQQLVREFKLEPGFIRNSLLLLKRKEN